MNKVEELQQEIEAIKDTCNHSWVETKAPYLIQTKKLGIYVGEARGPVELDYPLGLVQANLFCLVCTECTTKFKGSIGFTCPKCLVKLTEESLALREDYFGIDSMYYAVRLKHCTKCGFRVACDERDQ